jgi:hypothetical protein
MKIVLENPVYLHVQRYPDGELFVFADNRKRFKLKTLQDLNEECYVSGNISIPITSFFDGKIKVSK